MTKSTDIQGWSGRLVGSSPCAKAVSVIIEAAQGISALFVTPGAGYSIDIMYMVGDG